MFQGYEIIIILHPEILDEEIDGIVDRLKQAISESKGEYLNVEKWGNRKLVYKIKGLLKGYFLLIYLLGNPKVLQSIDRVLRYNEEVLRYQTIKLSKKTDLESLRESKSPETAKVSEEGKNIEPKKYDTPEDKALNKETKEGLRP